MKLYCLVEQTTIIKYNQTREQFGVGENSPESACVAKGYYLIVDSPPYYDTSTQRRTSTYVVNTQMYQVNKVYTITDIPQSELDARAQAELENEARRGLTDTAVLVPTDVNSTLDMEAQRELTKYRNDCINVLDAAHTTIPEVHHKVKIAIGKYKGSGSSTSSQKLKRMNHLSE